ncbi:uncharacterized protein SPPG_00406 [Spizellomyces punctatus DAOM BR117]|uniref:Uncharacterized protein n=1 Tax=Spizellomyces punctatus (strain DAOM BR117) TaxID=645134 RepID=A0A0L0HUX5_SPIPD|nr:uncharacterized protein SPPG_00406 [Spizellomyces punctatus DAOM BR117]KND04695.1 hypothetical protein SPPG_00406 [Spizellomyces punctatus DAOM BR117]|eukprot:XP_016612734.1 hypothetical protein SPPG_00406 [Spizellomyces punctatus DAOM BR117]
MKRDTTRPTPMRRGTAYEIIFIDQKKVKGRGKARSRSVDSQERALIRPLSPHPDAVRLRSWVVMPSPSLESRGPVPIFHLRRHRGRHCPYGLRPPTERRGRSAEVENDSLALIPSSSALPERGRGRWPGPRLTVPERLYVRSIHANCPKVWESGVEPSIQEEDQSSKDAAEMDGFGRDLSVLLERAMTLDEGPPATVQAMPYIT